MISPAPATRAVTLATSDTSGTPTSVVSRIRAIASAAGCISGLWNGALTGSRVFPARYSNTCWSLIATDDGVKVGASYEPADDKISSVSSFISQTGEDAALRKQTYEESLGWYAGITADMFS